MLWPPLILVLLAVGLAAIGWTITNGSGSADERAGGAIFFVFAAAAFGLAVVWWIVVVTWKAFG